MTEAERFFRGPDLSRAVDQLVAAAVMAVATQAQADVEDAPQTADHPWAAAEQAVVMRPALG
jgi:hypothetical protein